MAKKFLYTPITGQGLGVSYSSLHKVGEFLPSEGIGQTKLSHYANCTNGNLVVQDPSIKLIEENFQLDFFYTYNSLEKDPGKAWQFSIKKLNVWRDSNSPSANVMTMQEADGHLISYKKDFKVPFHYRPTESLGDGTPILHYEQTQKLWIWYHPGTHITECYSSDGLLVIRADAEGRKTNYQYSNGKLSAIIGPTGHRYEIRREDHWIKIYDTTDQQLLKSYEFDDLGRLALSQNTDGYQIKYKYDDNTSRLSRVQQSDQSKLTFQIDKDHKINTIDIGDGLATNHVEVHYPTPDKPHQASIEDGFGIKTTFDMDDRGNTIKLTRECGYDHPATEADVTLYSFNTQTQLIQKVTPSRGIETLVYDDFYGVVTEYTQNNGQNTKYSYLRDPNSLCLTPICKIIANSLDQPSAVTRYVYDRSYQNIDGQFFLRFEISAEGRVTEYRPDANGNIASERSYWNEIYDAKNMDPMKAPDLAEMTAWVARQNPQRISLSDYFYDSRGQRTTTKHYAHIDVDGNGIADAEMYVEYDTWDKFGNCTEKKVQQTAEQIAVTTQTFDQLQRLTSKKNALGEQTTLQYQDALSQVTTTYPNGSSLTVQADAEGHLIGQKAYAKDAEQINQSRITDYQRDSSGRIVATLQPDGKKSYSFF